MHYFGLALYRAGQDEEALAYLKKSEMKPHASPTHNAFVFAMIYHRLGDLDQSRQHYKRGVEGLKAGTPKDPDAPSWVIPPHFIYAYSLEYEAARVLNEGKSAPPGKTGPVKR